jgi:imidazolonepropionase-like amidohydrolase
MKKKPIYPIGLFLVLQCAGFFASGQGTFPVNGTQSEDGTVYAIKNVRLFIEPGKVEEDAVLVYSRGKILSSGKDKPIPANALVMDGNGRFIYPSFIDLFSDYGIKVGGATKKAGSSSYESSRTGAYAWNDAIKSERRAADYFEPDKEKAAELRKLGFGAVVTQIPDGVFRGTASLVTLGKQSANRELLSHEVTWAGSLNKGSSTQNYPSSLTGTIALIRQTLYDAGWYAKNGLEKERNLSLEALARAKNLIWLFEGREKYDVLRLGSIAKEFGLDMVVRGNGDEYQRAEWIKKAGLKLAIPLLQPQAPDVRDPYDAMRVSLSELKHWENAPFNAFFLHQNQVPFSITLSGMKEKDREKFWERLRLLPQTGLSQEAVLAALTTTPASWINYSAPLGTLKPGAPANFFMSTGDIFRDSSVVLTHWIHGESHTVNELPALDLRGRFLLKLPRGPELQVKVGGSAASPKGEFFEKEGEKWKSTFAVQGNRLVFTLKKKEADSLMRFEGFAFPDRWEGSGIHADGSSFAWKVVPSPASASDTLKREEKTESFRKPGTVWFPQNAYGFQQLPEGRTWLLKNATLWTGEEQGILNNQDILLVNGKIAKIGKNLSAPKDAEVLDCTGLHVTAGIVDEHSHIGLTRGVNEGGTNNSAEVRMGDVINADDLNIYRHLAGGVTTVQQLHGSANPIGGQSSIIKMRWGRSPEEMKFEGAAGFIKFALGENVKQSNWGEGWRYPQTRLGVEAFFIDQFLKAKEYRDQRKKYGDAIRRDLRMETLLEILDGKRFISCHSYVQSEINMLMKVADSIGFKVNTFTHILEGYKVADKMKAHGASASTFSDWWAYKFEVNDAIPYNAAILHNMGVNTGINSDDAEMARRLNQEAAKAVKYGGVSQEDAWNMVTLNPARMLHIDHKVGSLKEGKDADIVLWSANPLSIYARAEKTWVDGVLYFDRTADAAQRVAAQHERFRIIHLMLKEPEVKSGQAPKPIEKKEHLYHCDDLEQDCDH